MRNRLARFVGRVLSKATMLNILPSWIAHKGMSVAWSNLVSDGYKGNSAVWSCIRVHASMFPEPELHVYRRDEGGQDVIVPDHPARLLIANPNPVMGEADFWETWITYAAVGGNAYAWIERNLLGTPMNLWPLHDGQLSPVAHPTLILSHYELDPGDGSPKIPVPVQDVIQWRWAPDPDNPVRGLSPIAAAARMVDSDNEASRYEYALLRNDAVPRTMLTTKVPIGAPQQEQLKAQWKELYGGDNRGDIAVVSGDITVTRMGANMNELMIEAVHNIPESRIAAAMGGSAVGYLAGLNVHLQRNTYSNVREAREAYTEDFRIPTWRKVASVFTSSLLRQIDPDPALTFRFDTHGVRALAEDENAKRASVTGALSAGWLTVNEARAAVSLPPVSGGDVFIRAINVVPEQARVLEDGEEDVVAGGSVPGEEVDEEASGAEKTNRAMSASAIRELRELVASVAAGTLSEEAYTQLMQWSFNMGADDARRLLGGVSRGSAQP